MPSDSVQLRADLSACFPSLVIDNVAKESGQRVVYFAHFDDALIPADIAQDSHFLRGWSKWGNVVMKVVSDASASALTRLQAEARLLEELQLPQFPRLLYSNYFTENPLTDDNLTESLYVSVEEFVPSEPLSNGLDDYIGRPSSVFAIAISVVEGLRPLWEHPRKLVHRDVKPDNLLLTPSGRVVIIDFGIVRETGSRGITEEGWGKAPITVDFAAPEHIANDKDLVSFKSDVFSLGVVMYRLLAGNHPFRTRGGMDIAEVALATEEIIPPSLAEIGAAGHLQSSVVARMMQKKPYLRQRTADVLLEDLRAAKEESW
jgi:serine/threonine protein kinase